jgi:hypothetical protein
VAVALLSDRAVRSKVNVIDAIADRADPGPSLTR